MPLSGSSASLGIGALLCALLASSSADEDCAACARLLHAKLSHQQEASPVNSILGDQRLLVIRVDFSDLPGVPSDATGSFTTARLQHIVNELVDGFFETASYGKAGVALETDAVTPVLRLSETAESYAVEPLLERLERDAHEAAHGAGFALDSFDHVAVLMSSLADVPDSQVSYRGYADIGGRFSWFQGGFSPGLLAHELGHNFGLGHASLWQVPQGNVDPLHASGTKSEYGHAYDSMGRFGYDVEHRNVFGPATLRYLDWLPEDSVRTVEDSERFRIYPFDRRDAGAPDAEKLRGVRIPVDGHSSYWFSYRHRYDHLQEGLTVEVVDEGERTTLLLDMHPGGNLDDSALKLGQEFRDDAFGVIARVAETGGDIDPWVDLEVQFLPQIAFRQSEQSAVEASELATVYLDRLRTVSGEISLTWETVDGSAVSPDDFAASGGTVRWGAEDFAPKALQIPVVDDGREESIESFRIRLSQVNGAALASSSETVVNVVEPGAVDPTFNTPEIRGLIRDVAVQAEGRVTLAGEFSQIGSQLVQGVGRLLSTGDLDEAFVLARGVSKWPVHRVETDPHGRAIFGGAFRAFESMPAEGLVSVFADGTVDEAFVHQGIDGAVHEIQALSQGKWLVAGDFFTLGGHESAGVARILADGQVDRGWRAGLPAGSLVKAVSILPNQKIAVGGRFPDKDGHPTWGIARLFPDGAWDQFLASILPRTKVGGDSNVITKLLLTASGHLVVAGDFSAIDGVTVNNLARLAPNGEVDEAFIASIGTGPNGIIRDMETSLDGRLMVVGAFDWFDGQPRHGVARLRRDGWLDDWDPGRRLKTALGWSTMQGTSIAFQADGGVLLGLADQGGHRAWLTRVASGVLDLPGVLEFSHANWVARHGDGLRLPVVRRFGSFGEGSVRYVIRAESGPGGQLHAFPAGRLYWGEGDSETKEIRVAVPHDALVSKIEVQLFDIQGATELGLLSAASVDVREAAQRWQWLRDHFGVAVDETVLARDADSDNDGVSNLVEYALGRDPNDSSQPQGQGGLPAITLAAQGPTLEHCLELEVNLPQPLRQDIRYEIVGTDGSERSEVLATFDHQRQDWTMSSEKALPPVRLPAGQEGRQVLRFQDVVFASETDRRFMHLRVVIDGD